jgi:hypothetical protein
MKVLTQSNSHQLLAELSRTLIAAGDEGLWLDGLDAIDAYLAGLMTVEGDVALVTRGERQAVVWLKRRAKNPPVFRVEE